MDRAISLIQQGDASSLLRLLSSGELSPKERDKRGRTILFLAVLWGKFNIIKCLLDDAFEKYSEIIDFLFECRGGKKKWVNPLELAAIIGNYGFVKYFLKHCKFRSCLRFGWICSSALLIAEHPDKIESILLKEVRLNELETFNSELSSSKRLDFENFKKKCEKSFCFEIWFRIRFPWSK